ncbi:MAG TPA: hypothetical protein DDX39_07480 [Bacteroidales bacterium]|nr:MAG: hypothetical protein A2W98_02125 [Bacteroidetes bacterium GWF2_33_38]HBF88465.1 hypothetical protein [Bacteroidales bacterium]
MNLKLKFYFNALFILFFVSVHQKTFSQQQSEFITETQYNALVLPDEFDANLLRQLVFNTLNKQLVFNNREELEFNQILNQAAENQAEFMAEIDEVYEFQNDDNTKATIADRIQFFGGSRFGVENLNKTPIQKGKEFFSYKQIAEEIVFKWTSSKKSFELLTNQKYTLIGIGFGINEAGKKLYISFVLGNYKSLNNGAIRRKELDVPFSSKMFGLQPEDEKACKNCDKFKNIETLQHGLFVRNGKIVFKYNDLKALKKLIKKPTDALTVDVVQKEQYSCIGDNIIDNNLFNKGVLLKRVYSNKLYKKNLIKGEKVNEIEVVLGKFPKKIQGEYELNLVIIQDKYVCKNLSKTYLIDAEVESTNLLGLVADTVTLNNEKGFTPKVESSVLNFKIPFDKNKFTYKSEDVEPFIKSLNEPDFIINKLKISAFSSIEGSETENKILQEKRAESIINVLNSRQKTKISTEISTDENWEDFKKDILNSKHEKLASMTMSEAKEYLKTNNLQDELEPILSNHRYATIEMNITYDMMGQKEEAYVVSRFNKAVKEKNLPLALSIQKYIFKKILNETYSKDAVFNQIIPLQKDFAGLMMNKLWLEKYVNNSDINETYAERIEALAELDPFNSYINFNNLYCDVLFKNLGDDNRIKEIQDKISELYFTTLSKYTVDKLNLEYQFKIIKTLDTLETPHPKVVESLDRIKQIVNLKESNWQNSLKLSYMFLKQEDYDFARKLLEPFIDDKTVFEELIFTYISLCTFSEHKIYSNKFVLAMQKAQELNPERYCKLIKEKKLSFQIFENEKVKDDYCKNCH